MTPLLLLLFCLAPLPAAIVLGVIVCLVANNITATAAANRQWPQAHLANAERKLRATR